MKLVAFLIGVLGVLLCTLAAGADETARCDRTSSLGAVVDRCPDRVNPCCLERMDARYQIVRDSAAASPAAVLIVALAGRDGAASAEYSTPPVVDFWNEGWKAAQRYLPAQTSAGPIVALAMNAGPTRGYNRLHLHVSCASAKVLALLRSGSFSATAWTSIVLPGIAALNVPDRTFRVRITPALADDPAAPAARNNPFSLAVADVATPDLQNHALAIVAAAGAGGWYVLDRTMDPAGPRLSGYVEDVLDETCGGRSLRL
jgi:CDP-diacylglycerol pyrophosphatase